MFLPIIRQVAGKAWHTLLATSSKTFCALILELCVHSILDVFLLISGRPYRDSWLGGARAREPPRGGRCHRGPRPCPPAWPAGTYQLGRAPRRCMGRRRRPLLYTLSECTLDVGHCRCQAAAC